MRKNTNTILYRQVVHAKTRALKMVHYHSTTPSAIIHKDRFLKAKSHGDGRGWLIILVLTAFRTAIVKWSKKPPKEHNFGSSGIIKANRMNRNFGQPINYGKQKVPREKASKCSKSSLVFDKPNIRDLASWKNYRVRNLTWNLFLFR